jgi:multidrug resistance efflux pump
VFSLLPPDNATGNFTKIVQRLPVRIEVPAGVTAQRMLRPGMSVVVSVNTKPNAIKQDAARDAGLTSTANAAEAVPNLQSDAQ